MSIDMICKNILVLGNGFDLHHNLKTKYSDFIQFIRKLMEDNIKIIYKGNKEFSLSDIKEDKKIQEQTLQMYINKGFSEEAIVKMWSMLKNNFMRYFIIYNTAVNGWIDFESLIKNIILDIEKLLSKFDDSFNAVETDDYIKDINTREHLLARSFRKIFVTNEQREIYLNSDLKKIFGVDRKAIIKILRIEFDDLCNGLWVYLKDIEPYYREIKSEFTYQQIKNIKADAIITFNYTDTYKRYGIKSENVLHVHGSLQENNIVLGFNDDSEKELQYVYFKKYMQCILKHTPILEQYNFCTDKVNYGSPTIHFFGHSLDVTDREKLEYLFNNASEIKIYYYDEDDHEDKIEKIIDLLGKQNALNQMYEKTIEFVQIEKTEKEVEKEEEERLKPFKMALEKERREIEEEKNKREMFDSLKRQCPEFFS